MWETELNFRTKMIWNCSTRYLTCRHTSMYVADIPNHSLRPQMQNIKLFLTACKYPSWAIQRMKLKKNTPKQNRNNNRQNRSNNINRTSITVPYNKGLSESFKNIGRKFGIQVHFKSGRTLKEELVAPKDKDHITKKSGVIYRFKCDRLECDEEYIGETSRTFGERYREHLKASSPIHDHCNISGHTTSLDNFSIVGWEEQNLSRLIKESMYIRVNGPSLNKNIGKFHLPHLWDEVLSITAENLNWNSWLSGYSICH